MSDKLPCDVLVQPHTLIKAGCSVNTLMTCIEMRWVNHEKGIALPPIISRTQSDEIQSLRQLVERLEELLEIAVDDHDSHMGKSNVPAHWTNQARAALSPKVQEGE